MMIYAVIISFIIGIILMPLALPILRDLKCGQVVRLEGPKSHFKKEGTPTMGGIVIIISSLVGLLLAMLILNAQKNIKFSFFQGLLLVLPIITFGILGFIDDYLIVVKKNNNGLSPKVKFLCQVLLSALYFGIYLKMSFPTTIQILPMVVIDFKWLYGLIILGIMVSSSNAVNITDGLDGLAGGLMVLSFSSFMVLAYMKEEWLICLFCLAITGALVAFLFFNFHPARIMMGDTGSLALGASLGSVAILLKMEVVLLVIGLVYLVETLSVILQVSYYKKTRGKRLFRMAPLHHHFELIGYSESDIITLFYVIGFIVSILGIILGGIY